MRTQLSTAACVFVLVLALQAGGAFAADLPRRETTDQVLCVAGCDSRVPVVVQERARAPGHIDPTPPRSTWQQVTWGVYCADGVGCRAIGNVPFSRHRGSYSSTIHVYVHRYPF